MGSLFINLLVTGLVIATISISYFYIYLPAITNHGETITVPDLHGMSVEELDDYLLQHDLRWAVDDSSYSEEYPPLAVLQQYPKANSRVKEKRVIYVSVNRVAPPTVPIPDLVDRSRINAEVVLKSNELRRGKIILISSPFLNLVKEMRYNGTEIEAGTRVPKGAVIDLVVGDGYGPRDFVVGSLIGDSYERALFKLKGWNLFLGNVEIPIDVDTTGIEIFVYKQRPLPGDSVRVGDPVNLWVANKGYQEKEEPEDIEIEEDETIINTLNKLVLLLVLSGSSWVCRAQFIIVPIERSELWSKEVVNARQQSLTAMPLPFWDDFSFSQTPFYPNDTLWENSNSVILSDGLGINLPSHKVGSFDGLDSVGRPYNVNDILAKGFADKLISRPLRLDLVDPSERTGVYLSFYFQYRGNGEPPDPGDQLILSFKGSDGVWYTVETYEDDESYMSDVFYQQVVQVSGDIYFHDDFQFRFQNKGRISGPYDTWNIDYIYLNKGRTLSDTSYPDRTISSSLTSPFSGYWAIPVRHYFVNPGAQVGTPSFEIYNLRVGNNQPLNYFSYSEINQYKDGVESKSFHLLDSAEDVGGSLNGLERRNVALTTVPDVSFFNPTSDSIHVDIKVGLSTKDNVPPSGQGDYDPAIYNPIDFRHNDTIRATYSLSNYYAYDDGGAEYGAALNQSGSRVAYLFEMRTTDADTLIAVDIYFPKFGDESAQNILLQILSNLNDEPSSILHQQLVPVQRTGLNKFVRIPLLKTITIQSQFYIGWQQLSFAVIAVGLDKNSNSSDRIYFNTSNVWVQDVALAGSLMIRPVFGEGDGIISGLEDRTPDMGPYPNPTSDKFYLARDAKNISVYDFAGRAIDLFFSEEEDRIMIKLQNPSSGVYILRYLQNGKVKTSRLLVSPDQR